MKAMVELNVKCTMKSLPVQASSNSSGEPDLEADPSRSKGELDFIKPLDLLRFKKYLNLVKFVRFDPYNSGNEAFIFLMDCFSNRIAKMEFVNIISKIAPLENVREARVN